MFEERVEAHPAQTELLERHAQEIGMLRGHREHVLVGHEPPLLEGVAAARRLLGTDERRPKHLLDHGQIKPTVVHRESLSHILLLLEPQNVRWPLLGL